MKKVKSQPALLEDEDENEELEFKVNKDYAKKYSERKQKEDLMKLKQKLADESDDDDDEDEEEEDEIGVKDIPEWDNTFLKILPKIIRKDPEIYEKKTFFTEPTEQKEEKTKTKKDKPIYLKDYIRNTLLETEGKGFESEEEEEANTDLSIVQQQAKLKKDLLAAAKKVEEENEDEDDFFSLRKKSKEEQEQEEQEFQAFEDKEKAKYGEKKGPMGDMELLKEYWKAQELDENERFLRDFILNKGWIEKTGGIPTYAEIVGEHDDEDEEAVEQQEKFEEELAKEKDREFQEKYVPPKYRYLEEGGTEIKSYPRVIEDSLRRDRKSEKRKEKRHELKDKKEEKMKQKEEELKRLKNLKKLEISKKLKEIQKITGIARLEETGLDQELDDDFNPEDWDKKMAQVFNDTYYDEGESGPLDFDPLEGLEDIKEDEDDEDPSHGKEEKEEEEEEEESKEGAGKLKSSVLDELHAKKVKTRKEFLKLKKDALDKTKEQLDSYLEEYYKLDYEDLIDGTTPCRFKYTSVPKSTYGLSLTEILVKDDEELNKKSSLKRIKAVYADHTKKRSWGNRNDQTGERNYKRGNNEQYNNNNNNYNNQNNNYKKDYKGGENGHNKRQKTSENNNGNNNNNNKKNTNNNNTAANVADPNKKTTIRERKKRLKEKKKMMQQQQQQASTMDQS